MVFKSSIARSMVGAAFPNTKPDDDKLDAIIGRIRVQTSRMLDFRFSISED